MTTLENPTAADSASSPAPEVPATANKDESPVHNAPSLASSPIPTTPIERTTSKSSTHSEAAPVSQPITTQLATQPTSQPASQPVSQPVKPQVHPAVTKLKAQLALQRRHLEGLEIERQQYKAESKALEDRLQKTKEKMQQREQARIQLEKNYNDHLRSMRATNDDLDSIADKLRQLKQQIANLADELMDRLDPVVATQALQTFWLNLQDPIQEMGSPLPLPRIRMLTEKFIMDVLVQNMNLNVFPGLQVADEYNQLQYFFEKHDPAFSIRLRQEIALVVVAKNIRGNDVHQSLYQAVQNNWKFLYGGLIKAYPSIYQYDKAETDVRKQYGAKVQMLVEHSMALGFAMKGQEVDIAAADTRERVQPFNPELMIDQDNRNSGIVQFCICPPFVVYGSQIRALEKGRVLCSANP
ncbi:uncharacterized protein BYT42DRAFT_143145 [Radiomyces spectabilis]|uniref:uncharacterized protein n=1 Tax=Radiomyces spectabilis TaxID=64574 RepID=UPI00221EAF96|nr:uncharacterized protein BYT42DRAFT_143145 [Radiomyces spectabilis]KAI8366783.1 hypothetical protein BYT42DRAFT_143145 [Radiomyces spectabilis]